MVGFLHRTEMCKEKNINYRLEFQKANILSSSRVLTSTKMSSLRLLPVLILLLQTTILLSFHVQVQADEEDDLFRGINNYRRGINLSALTENKNAECFADEMADQFKKQPCTNSTGSNTVPGTEPQFSNYPTLLEKCNLNITNTEDGMIMPVCVPGLVSDLVLSNFTETQYSGYLNDTKYTGAGIGSEGDWIVVVLSTNTADGSFVKADNSAGIVVKVGLVFLLPLLMGFFFVLLN